MISDHNDADFEEKVKQVSKDVFELHTTVENVLKGEISRSMRFMPHSFVWAHLLGRKYNCWILVPSLSFLLRGLKSARTQVLQLTHVFFTIVCCHICLLRKDRSFILTARVG